VNHHFRAIKWAGAATLALGACFAIAQGTRLQAGQSAIAVDDGALAPATDWALIGGDWSNARYSRLTQISPANVKQLGGAWMRKFDNSASTRATPVVKDGLMFISAGAMVYALNPKTGEPVWTWRSDQANARNLAQTSGLVDALNSGNRFPAPAGVAVGEGMVFVGLTNGSVAALRQSTGEVVWAQPIGDNPPSKGESVSAAPTYARGTVFAGLANGDWALRGRVVALDAKTGTLLWTFFTVPGPGEFGHETWPKDSDVWKQGGGGVWLVGAADAELGLVYYVTGNAVPMFGGEARKGDNLFTASVLALDMKSGQRRWHYQVVHHDLWDADIAVPPVLYDAQVNGKPRKALAAMRADGYLFLLDRETGRPVFPVEERRVTQDPMNHTAATQPFPVGADSLVPGCSTYKDRVRAPWVLDCSGFVPPFINRHNVVAPGAPIPGVRVTPMAFSPQTGYFYAQGSGSVGRARRISDDPWFRGGSTGAPGLPPGTGVVAAIDSRTNRIVWKKEVPPTALGNSGPMTTASGLMFRGAGDGNFEAYDAKTGDLLWSFQTGNAGLRGPASTFEVEGEQYIALATGPALWAFRLGGTVAPLPAPRAAGGPGGGAAGQETDEIETATLVQSAERGVGQRYAVDEHAFNPTRARVRAGARITFVNNGRITHTIAAEDGSWTVGPLQQAQSGYATFSRPGTYLYMCKEHPWAIGQITVQ
jgi:alcohol dehydrogenase (cytochrome c)